VDQIRKWLRDRYPQLRVATTEHRPVAMTGESDGAIALAALTGRPVAGFCGIGNPAAFRHTLESLGANVIAFKPLPDHHPYSREDVEQLRNWANGLPTDAMVATTQKDWVKLRIADLAGRPLRTVRIGLAFRDGREAFDEMLRSVIPVNGRDAEDDTTD
jgi:tetraacyldisaccharide 4'-kinase